MKVLTLFSILLLSFCNVFGQIVIGQQDSLYSRILGENRLIYVYMPQSASSNPDAKYPVAYLLDAETYFPSFAATVSHLSEVNGNGIIPEMVVIGIVNTDRALNFTPSKDTAAPVQPNGGGREFLRFLEEELIPFVEQRYPVVKHRTLVGHSLAGLFVLSTMLQSPKLFNSYLCLDPAVDWHKKRMLTDAKVRLPAMDLRGNTLFLGASSLCLKSNAELDSTLKSSSHNGLNWTTKNYPDDSHGSLPLIASYDGLRFIFNYYKRPSFVTITDSSLTVLKRHYKYASQRLGYTVSPPQNLLLGLAWRSRVLEKNSKRALTFLEEAERLYPLSVDVAEAMIEIYAELGNMERHKHYLVKANKLRSAK